jgi:hypothetical protein
MSKKPAAALSASLVAVKGTASPAPDMPGRATPSASAAPAPDPRAEELRPIPHGQPRTAAEPDGEGGLSPLNFRVSASFRREFKTYAARHDMKLNELLRRSFEAFRKAQGD